jgi:hypothetical protein
MDKNFNLIASELFNKIKTQFPSLTLGDKDRKDISDDTVENARFFEFDYVHDGEKLGHITITLSEKDGLVVIFSNDLVGDKSEYVKKRFFNFLKELREFAKQKFLNFDTRDISKSNLEKRDYKFLSKNEFGESKMSESKLFGTAKTSYQRIGEATLIIKHRDFVNQENPAGRAQRIESIYVENTEGERFKYPHRHLNGARALAQHVAHGGNPYDNVGKYVIGLSEELSKLRMFKSYVDRNETISEAMGSVHSKVVERIEQVKKEIHNLQRASVYEEFVESFEEPSSVEIPEDVMSDWIDRLTIRSFNEELKNVFPYIFKLVSEDDIPVRELEVEDIVEEDEVVDENNQAISNDFETKISELDEYETFLNSIAEDRSELFGDQNQDLIAQLNQLIADEIPLGQDGTNAINSLKGIIDDDELQQVFKEMADIDPALDARDIIRDYIEQKDQEYGTGVLNQLNFEPEMGADATDDMATSDADVVPSEEEPFAEPTSELPAEEPAAELPPAAPVQEMLRSGFDELKEFIGSMYNKEEGNFPKGVEGVKIACEKKFGDRVGPIAEKIINRLQSIGEMRRIKELSGVQGVMESKKKSIFERLDPEARARLDDLIDKFKTSVDPNYDSYGVDDHYDPDDIIDRIRQDFGDSIADMVSAGANKMHFSRDNRQYGLDPLKWKEPINRQTKAGKMYKQDSDYRKNNIKDRYRHSGRSSTHRGDVNLPEVNTDDIAYRLGSGVGTVKKKWQDAKNAFARGQSNAQQVDLTTANPANVLNQPDPDSPIGAFLDRIPDTQPKPRQPQKPQLRLNPLTKEDSELAAMLRIAGLR